MKQSTSLQRLLNFIFPPIKNAETATEVIYYYKEQDAKWKAFLMVLSAYFFKTTGQKITKEFYKKDKFYFYDADGGKYRVEFVKYK